MENLPKDAAHSDAIEIIKKAYQALLLPKKRLADVSTGTRQVRKNAWGHRWIVLKISMAS